MLHTLVRVTVYCDTIGCPAVAERILANGDPRALLAAVRRSLRRRDGWALASRLPLIGPHRDLCPTCQTTKLPTAEPTGRTAEPAAVPTESATTLLDQLFDRDAVTTDSTVVLPVIEQPERTPDVAPTRTITHVRLADADQPTEPILITLATDSAPDIEFDAGFATGPLLTVPDTVPEDLLAHRPDR